MERETGIEPATNGLGSRDSTTELLPLKLTVLRDPSRRSGFRQRAQTLAKRLKLLPLGGEQSVTPRNWARNFGLQCMDPKPHEWPSLNQPSSWAEYAFAAGIKLPNSGRTFAPESVPLPQRLKPGIRDGSGCTPEGVLHPKQNFKTEPPLVAWF